MKTILDGFSRFFKHLESLVSKIEFFIFRVPNYFLYSVMLFPILLTFFIKQDHADGTIIDSAFRSGDFSGVNNWWIESGLVPYVFWSWLHENALFVVDADFLRILSPIITYLLLAIALFLFIRRSFAINTRTTLLILIPFVFLFASLLSSSVFWPMLTFFSVGVLGLFFIIRFNKLGVLLGLPLVILGMSYLHAVPFFILFCALFIFNRATTLNEAVSWQWLAKSVFVIIAMSVAFFVIYKVIWMQHGLYSDYGSVKLSISSLKTQIRELLKAPLVVGACLLVLITAMRRRSPIVLLSLGFLVSFGGALGLFALTGKYVDFVSAFGRPLDPFVVRYSPPTIGLVFLALCASLPAASGQIRTLTKVTMGLFAVMMMTFYVATAVFALQHQSRTSKMIDYLATLKKTDKICMVDPSSKVGHLNYQFYQLNYLTQLAENRLPGQVCVLDSAWCVSRTQNLCAHNKSVYLTKYIIDPTVCEQAAVADKDTLIICETQTSDMK